MLHAERTFGRNTGKAPRLWNSGISDELVHRLVLLKNIIETSRKIANW